MNQLYGFLRQGRYFLGIIICLILMGILQAQVTSNGINKPLKEFYTDVTHGTIIKNPKATNGISNEQPASRANTPDMSSMIAEGIGLNIICKSGNTTAQLWILVLTASGGLITNICLLLVGTALVIAGILPDRQHLKF